VRLAFIMTDSAEQRATLRVVARTYFRGVSHSVGRYPMPDKENADADAEKAEER
jgi:hypothetical protein